MSTFNPLLFYRSRYLSFYIFLNFRSYCWLGQFRINLFFKYITPGFGVLRNFYPVVKSAKAGTKYIDFSVASSALGVEWWRFRRNSFPCWNINSLEKERLDVTNWGARCTRIVSCNHFNSPGGKQKNVKGDAIFEI